MLHISERKKFYGILSLNILQKQLELLKNTLHFKPLLPDSSLKD